MSKHIVLATTGSYGDVFPFIAIALQLKARGHRAVIATSEIFRQIIESGRKSNLFACIVREHKQLKRCVKDIGPNAPMGWFLNWKSLRL